MAEVHAPSISVGCSHFKAISISSEHHISMDPLCWGIGASFEVVIYPKMFTSTYIFTMLRLVKQTMVSTPEIFGGQIRRDAEPIIPGSRLI